MRNASVLSGQRFLAGTRFASLEPTLQKQKDLISRSLEKSTLDEAIKLLTELAPVLLCSADIGTYFMTGSDFLDALIELYKRSTGNNQRTAIASTVFVSICSLVNTDVFNASLLSDHLYALRAQAGQSAEARSLLSDLVTRYNLLHKLRQSVNEKAPDRLFSLLDSLESYRSSMSRQQKHAPKSRRQNKKAESAVSHEIYMHRMSLVAQVQDLFPDLGSGFTLKLLDEYHDDVEQVTMQLLDDSLPPHLASLDRTEEARILDADPQTVTNHLAPRSTPPPPKSFIPDRRNTYDDNDDIHALELGTSRLHFGKQNTDVDNDVRPNKAAILSALAAFDSDDDERDDTYDVEDVGGTIDSAHDADREMDPLARARQEDIDMTLFRAYQQSPTLFDRNSDARRGQARTSLKQETGFTDEAIEGWAIMLQREPRRLQRLAQLSSDAFDGRQPELGRTAFRDDNAGGATEIEDSGIPGPARGGDRDQVRGRGRGGYRGRGRGGSGNVAGPAHEPSTANAQRRKEASKSSRANHNRRNQRAKKMARGGFVG